MPIEQFLQYGSKAFISARQASSQVCQLTTLFGIAVGFISHEEIHVACTQFILRQGSLWHEAQSGYVLKKSSIGLSPICHRGRRCNVVSICRKKRHILQLQTNTPPQSQAARRQRHSARAAARSACSGLCSADGASSESGCGPRHGLRRTSATVACAGTAASPVRVVGTAGASSQPGC